MDNFVEILVEVFRFIFWAVIIKFIVEIIIGLIELRLLIRLRDQQNVIQDLQKKSIKNLHIENSNGCVYVWDKDTMTFLGQGRTKEELQQSLSTRFPDSVVEINEKLF